MKYILVIILLWTNLVYAQSFAGVKIGEGTGLTFSKFDEKNNYYELSLHLNSIFYNYRVLYGLNYEILKSKSSILRGLYALSFSRGIKILKKINIHYYFGGELGYLPRFWYRVPEDSFRNNTLLPAIVSESAFIKSSLLFFRVANGLNFSHPIRDKILLNCNIGIAFDILSYKTRPKFSYNDYRLLYSLPRFGAGLFYKIK